jgi:hypothetical protein
MGRFLHTLYGLFIVTTLLVIGMFFYGQKKVDTNLPPTATLELETPSANTSTTTKATTTEIQEPLARESRTAHKSTSSPKVLTTVKKDTSLVVKKVVPIIENIRHMDSVDTTQRTNYKNPCTQTVSYSLGSIDSRFSISKEDFLTIVRRSTDTWNRAGNKTFFAYALAGGDITVSLVYDERQQNTVESSLQKAEIENSKNAASTLQDEYTREKEAFNEKKELYTSDLNVFNDRQQKYNESVTMWNAKGGAPQQEYNNLIEERDSLTRENARLQGIYKELQDTLTTINQKIDRYNELVRYVNDKIAQVNTLANKQFTEGNYSSGSNTITIFQYSDEVKLERVLTHEFGHALGLDHLDTEDSIMYYLNTKSTLALSNDDIRAMKDICKIP